MPLPTLNYIDACELFGFNDLFFELRDAFNENWAPCCRFIKDGAVVWRNGFSDMFYNDHDNGGVLTFNMHDYPHFRPIYDIMLKRIPHEELMQPFVIEFNW